MRAPPQHRCWDPVREEPEAWARETGPAMEMGEGCTLMGTQGYGALEASIGGAKEEGWAQVTGTGIRRQKDWDLGMSTSVERVENWAVGTGRCEGKEGGCPREMGRGSL